MRPGFRVPVGPIIVGHPVFIRRRHRAPHLGARARERPVKIDRLGDLGFKMTWRYGVLFKTTETKDGAAAVNVFIDHMSRAP